MEVLLQHIDKHPCTVFSKSAGSGLQQNVMTGPANKPKEKTGSSLQHRRFVIVCVYYIFISMLYLWCTHIPYIYVHQGWGTAKDLQNDGKKHTAVNTNIKQKLTFTNCFAQGCMSNLSSSSFIWSQDVLFTGDQAKVHGWHRVPQPTMAVPALTLAELWKNRASVRATWPRKPSDLKTYKVNFEMGWKPTTCKPWEMLRHRVTMSQSLWTHM